MAENNAVPGGIKVNAGTYRGSMYSQLVGVTVSDVDITLEFVYVHPRDKTQGEVVSRVTLPRLAGKGLAETILKTIMAHEAKKGPKN
jgi:hypothetical protein